MEFVHLFFTFHLLVMFFHFSFVTESEIQGETTVVGAMMFQQTKNLVDLVTDRGEFVQWRKNAMLSMFRPRTSNAFLVVPFKAVVIGLMSVCKWV